MICSDFRGNIPLPWEGKCPSKWGILKKGDDHHGSERTGFPGRNPESGRAETKAEASKEGWFRAGPSSGGTPVQGVTAEKAEPAFPSPGANALEEGVLPKKRRKQKAAADEGQDDNGSSIQALIAKAVQAKKAVVIAEKRYDVGKGTVLELNSSQVSLTQAQLTYNQSIYDYLVAKADLDQVLGKE